MRCRLAGTLILLLLSAGAAPAQYEYGFRSRFGGTAPRSSFYAPNSLTMNYQGVVGRGYPGYGVAGLPGDFSNPFVPRNIAPARLEPVIIPEVIPEELPATLTVEFPAPAAVWANGKPVSARSLQIALDTPPLRYGETFDIRIRARWEVKGKPVEYARTVEVSGGRSVRLTVLAGNQ
jgi:uncharacterized protein (TIGR03000 family)